MKQQEKIELRQKQVRRMRKRQVRRHKPNLHNLWWVKGKKCAVPGCQVTDLAELTLDHIVPIALALRLGWRNKQIRAWDNLQLLCRSHHRKKDRGVKSKTDQMDRQHNLLQYQAESVL